MALSAEEVCLILRTSAKAGVAELKFADLHVRFGRPAEQVVVMDPQGNLSTYPYVPQAPAPRSGKALSEEQHQKQNAEALEQEELRTRDQQLAEALVTDPLKYEELLQSGELTNESVDAANEDDDDLDEL